MAEKPLKSRVSRASLISAGGYALSVSIEKIQGKYTEKGDRLAYIRCVAALISAISGVMRDTEMEELEARIEKLEEAVKKSGKAN